MKYRIIRKHDGLWYPQYKRLFIWRCLKETLYPRAEGVMPFDLCVECKDEQEARDYLNTHSEEIKEI